MSNKLPVKMDLEEGGVSLLLGFVAGKYMPVCKPERSVEVIAGLYFNSFYTESPYSLIFMDEDHELYGHHSPFSEDVSISMIILELFYEFIIPPYEWSVIDVDSIADGLEAGVLSEYKKRLDDFSEIVNCFKQKEMAKKLSAESVSKSLGIPESDYLENSRLFYLA